MSGLLCAFAGGHTHANEPPPTVIGQAYGGGYYAGNITDDGIEYYLVVAPKEGGEQAYLEVKTTSTFTPGTASDIDGPTNSSNMNNSEHPAAYFCENLVIGGRSDWYLPALNELEICYYNLKPTAEDNAPLYGAEPNGVNPNAVPPRSSGYTTSEPTQTSVQIFRNGYSEAFNPQWYWTSTEANSVGFQHYISFQTGEQGGFYKDQKDSNPVTRAVRRVRVV